MYLEVYPDVIFILNFIIDLILLLLLRMINKRSTTLIRMLLAAAAGGITAAIVGIFPWMNIIIRFLLMTVITSVLMLLIAFGKMKKTDFIKQVITLYLLTYFLGGLINSIYYQTNFKINLVHMGNLLYSNLTWKAVLFIVILVIPAAFCVLWLNRVIKSKRRETLDVQLFLGEKSVSVKGLVDTGNCLYDPVFRKPVIIIENMLLKELMPMDLYQKLLVIKGGISDKTSCMENLDILCTNQLKLRIIPYQSIGKQKGLLLGLVLDKVLVRQGKDTICNEKVTAAIYDDLLSAGNEYHAILHKELL